MRLSLGPRLRIIARCSYCEGTVAEHGENCPVARLESLREKQKHIHCPKCGANAVDANQNDYYECRGCNTQYCSVGYGKSTTGEMVILVTDQDAPLSEGVSKFHVLVEKGKGKFPIDKLIDELREALEKKQE